jgi:hypothetical protein
VHEEKVLLNVDIRVLDGNAMDFSDKHPENVLFNVVAAARLGMETYSSALQLENAAAQFCTRDVFVKVTDLRERQDASIDCTFVAAGIFKDIDWSVEQLLNMLSRVVARVRVPNVTFLSDVQPLNMLLAAVTAPMFGISTLIRLRHD